MDDDPYDHLGVDLRAALLPESDVGRTTGRTDQQIWVWLVHPFLVWQVLVTAPAMAGASGLLAPLALHARFRRGLGPPGSGSPAGQAFASMMSGRFFVRSERGPKTCLVSSAILASAASNFADSSSRSARRTTSSASSQAIRSSCSRHAALTTPL